jgi:hypothetical protein
MRCGPSDDAAAVVSNLEWLGLVTAYYRSGALAMLEITPKGREFLRRPAAF